MKYLVGIMALFFIALNLCSPPVLAGSTESISVIPDEVTITVYQGRSQGVILTVKNLTDSYLNLTVEISNGILAWMDQGLISITFSPTTFSLSAGETQEVFVVTVAHDLMPAGTYTGQIILSDGTAEVIVPTTIEVIPLDVLFDVKIKALTKALRPGQTLEVEMNLMNFGALGADANYMVWMVTPNNDLITIENATIYIRERQMVVETYQLQLPDDVTDGIYTIRCLAEFLVDGKRVKISAVDTAVVQSPEISLIDFDVFGAFIVGLLGGGIASLFILRHYFRK
jgi:hypothetical protein